MVSGANLTIFTVVGGRLWHAQTPHKANEYWCGFGKCAVDIFGSSVCVKSLGKPTKVLPHLPLLVNGDKAVPYSYGSF